MKITYSVGDSIAAATRRRTIGDEILDPPDEDDMLEICEQCAADHHSNFDGWESQWPITVRLYLDGQSEPICTAEVDLEYEPTFEATRKMDGNEN